MGGVTIRGAAISNGNYVGDSTANKAIAHGLGRIPKMVFVYGWDDVIHAYIAQGGGIQDISSPAGYAETAMNAQYFYVGNAADYHKSANFLNAHYEFCALG